MQIDDGRLATSGPGPEVELPGHVIPRVVAAGRDGEVTPQAGALSPRRPVPPRLVRVIRCPEIVAERASCGILDHPPLRARLGDDPLTLPDKEHAALGVGHVGVVLPRLSAPDARELGPAGG